MRDFVFFGFAPDAAAGSFEALLLDVSVKLGLNSVAFVHCNVRHPATKFNYCNSHP